MDGLDSTQQTYIGASINLTGLSETFNMPNGTNQTISLAPSYYTFTSSNPSVATVSESGVVTVLTGGTTVISATLAGTPAVGSLIINSLGTFTAAPTPTVNPANVISLFSNAYTNVPVEYYNGYWAPWQTTLGQDDIHINGDDLIKYSQFNFVGIQFSQPTINASQMTYVHVDLKVLNTTGARNSIKIKLVDFGADGVYGGLIDSSHEYVFNSSSLPTGTGLVLNFHFLLLQD